LGLWLKPRRRTSWRGRNIWLGRAFFYAWTQAIFVTIDQFIRIGKGVGLGSIHLNPDQLGLFIEHCGLEHTPVALFISEANQIPMS
jgi:hypothetical protein